MVDERAIVVTRRQVVAGSAALGLMAAVPLPAVAATAPATLPFTVLREPSLNPLGSHRVTFRRDGEMLRVDVTVRIKVKLGPIPIFSYTHDATETWKGGRLVSLDSGTNDNNRILRVAVRKAADGLQVSGVDGTFIAPPDIVPTSYWNRRLVEATEVLDSQNGRLVQLTSRFIGHEEIKVDGTSIGAEHWYLESRRSADIWYSDAGQWVKMAFTARGTDIEYRLDALPPEPPPMADAG
jgi:hypothetical protein